MCLKVSRAIASFCTSYTIPNYTMLPVRMRFGMFRTGCEAIWREVSAPAGNHLQLFGGYVVWVSCESADMTMLRCERVRNRRNDQKEFGCTMYTKHGR